MKRIRQVVRKEFIQIKRDHGLLRTVAVMPLIQLLIYGYVVATEIRALPVAVLDYSPSAESRFCLHCPSKMAVPLRAPECRLCSLRARLSSLL